MNPAWSGEDLAKRDRQVVQDTSEAKGGGFGILLSVAILGIPALIVAYMLIAGHP